ncbi:hypothetical protein [Fodinibius sp. AD559]|uniref:hypothetical protein n=1 Tax=Fodinibius sp. AD559 TaxID=3424179 RepID=UPI004046E3A6
MIGIHRKNYLGVSNILLLMFFMGVLLLLIPLKGEAQDNRLIHTNSWEYEYIKRLQQRGHLLEMHPSKLPYAVKDLHQSLKKLEVSSLGEKERRWVNMLKKSVESRPENVDSMRVGGLFEPGARHSSSDRLNVDDPMGEGKPILPRARLNSYLEWKNWIGQAGITFDWFYDIDPDGLDTVRRLYIRSEDTYLGFNGDRVDLYVGRFNNHWSVFDRQGSFLTDNPQSFDQIQFTLGSSKISFSSILGEMDNMGADSTFTGRSYGFGALPSISVFTSVRLESSPEPQA